LLAAEDIGVPGLPLGIRRYIVNLIANAGSNST
jgi:hypothetical protein